MDLKVREECHLGAAVEMKGIRTAYKTIDALRPLKPYPVRRRFS